MLKSKVKTASDISITDKDIDNIIDKEMAGTQGAEDYLYFGANDLENRKESVFVKKKDWDGDVKALENE